MIRVDLSMMIPRRIGLGFGVGSVIAVRTWSVAVLTSAAVTYTWGISGLFWFVVPNGLAIMLLAPFALHLRKKLPAGPRTFLWAGAWFYPIPITVGLLGFVGIALGITVPDQIADPAAIGPFVISHIGLPVALVVLFTLVILNASFPQQMVRSRL
jgi:hypothetical protein